MQSFFGRLASGDGQHQAEVEGEFDEIPGRHPDCKGRFELPVDVLGHFARSQPCQLTIEDGPDMLVLFEEQHASSGDDHARVEFVYAGEPE